MVVIRREAVQSHAREFGQVVLIARAGSPVLGSCLILRRLRGAADGRPTRYGIWASGNCSTAHTNPTSSRAIATMTNGFGFSRAHSRR